MLYLALSQEYGVFYYFLPFTYTLDQIATALHVHMCTKAQLDFDGQLLSFNVYVYIKSVFVIEIIQLKSVKSRKIPNEKFCRIEPATPNHTFDAYTVKPVYKGHPWDLKNVAVMQRVV